MMRYTEEDKNIFTKERPYYFSGCGFTLIEMLVVIAIIGILAAMLSGPLMRALKTARIAACSNNLAQIGKATFQYESPSNFDATPMRVPPTSGNEGANGTTLAPLVALFATGMLDNKSIVTCPVGDSGLSVAKTDATGIGLKDQEDTAANSLATSAGTEAASHYLFTLYYSRSGKGNRVVAADAADASATGTDAFSPNHGDTASSKQYGANVLFKDGHVVSSRSYSHVKGSVDTSNLWGDEDAPASISDTEKTQIGHY